MKNRVLGTICGLILTLAACGGGSLEGKYTGTVPTDFGPRSATLDFRSGGKVFATQGSDEKAGTFEVDGEKVTVIIDGHSTVFTRGSDGTLTGRDIKFTKK